MKITNYIVQQIYSLGLANAKYSSDIYSYGINTGINILLNLSAMFIISFFQNKIIVCFEFFFFFIPLRSISGGFHFSSKRICFIVSTLIFYIIINSQDFILRNFTIFLVLTFFCAALIIIIPITESNMRRLNPNDIIKFQRKKISLCNVYIVVLISLLLFKLKKYITPIISAIILITVLLIIDLTISIYKKYTSS